VDFIHRTAHEFLTLPETWKIISSRAKNPFDPNVRLVEAHILMLKVATISSPGDHFHDVRHLTINVLLWARIAGKPFHGLDILMLDELDRTAKSHWLSVPRSSYCSNIISYTDIDNLCLRWAHYHYDFQSEERDDLVSLVVSFGLTNFVKTKLLHGSTLVRKKKGKPLLECAFRYGTPEIDIISLLLKFEADPNQQYQGRSIWQNLLGSIYRSAQNLDPGSLYFTCEINDKFTCGGSISDQKEQWLSIFKLFIEAGANPNTLCHYFGVAKPLKPGSSVSSPIEEDFDRYVIGLRTPLWFFSPEGPLPDFELENALKSRGAVAFMEEKDTEASYCWEAKVEALKLRDESVPRVEKLFKKARSKGFWGRKFRTEWKKYELENSRSRHLTRTS
jgi:hypothetical protein